MDNMMHIRINCALTPIFRTVAEAAPGMVLVVDLVALQRYLATSGTEVEMELMA
jgi:hypothetical protein